MLPPAIVTGWQLTQIVPVLDGRYTSEIYRWITPIGLDLTFRLDGLSLFFGLIVTGIGAAVALYTAYYFEDDAEQGRFYLYLFLFMTCMLGLVWADNLLTLFVFWEGTSITSYLLIGFKVEDKAAHESARTAFVVTGLGGLIMLVGFLLLGATANTFTISELIAQPQWASSPTLTWALALILVGAFTKSAQFPFHFWLPGAMTAPSPASAYLHSATMVKAGVYLLARLHPAFAHYALWWWALALAGSATMLLGAVSALRYHDLKALLANATVSQLGVLVLLLAFDSEAAVIAVVVGVLAHALYKGPLFLLTGILQHATGGRDMRQLGGLWRTMPWVTVTALLATLSMAGLPPFLGFLAKETLLETLYESWSHGGALTAGILLAAAITTGAFFVAYSITLLWEAFLRAPAKARPQDSESGVHLHRPHFAFVVAPLSLALFGSALPFLLNPLGKYALDGAASAISGDEVHMHLSLWHGFTPVLFMSLTAIGLGFVIFWMREGIRALFARVPESVNGNVIFGRINDRTYDLAFWVTRTVQGSSLASQIAVIFGFACLLTLYAILDAFSDLTFEFVWTDAPLISETIVAALAVVAAVATARARTRVSAIIALGVVGVTVMLFFIFFSAPDLALTQLLIEVLTTTLLLLIFMRVKPTTLPATTVRRKMRNIFVAGAMGLFGFALVLLTSSVQIDESISGYFLRFAEPKGYGRNVVNVILVDFRGFDTMGEITVLAIAAMGGYALLRTPRLQDLRRQLQTRTQTQTGGEEE